MKLKAILLLAALGVASVAHADLLSLYDFNDASTTGTSAANAALLLSADGGLLKSTTTLTTTAAIANVVSFSGTITNAVAGDTSGAALAIQGGTNEVNNGTNLTFSVTAAAGKILTGLDFSFAGQRTATGFNSYRLAYSINGGSFTNFGNSFDLNPSTSPGFGNSTTSVASAIRDFNLSTIGTNIHSLSLRLTYTGSTSSAGNLRLDNIQLNGKTQAVPEPASIVILGLGALALVIARRSR